MIVLTAAEFLIFSLSYRKQKRASLISVILLIVAGIVFQEVLGGECRTAYVALTLGVTLMFIHYAGDELIAGAARCIEKAVGGTGKCYRTGGDEFVVILNIEKEEADNILVRLQEETSMWSSDTFDFSMSIAAGYAREKDYQGLTAEELIKRADKAMYASKAAYYLKRL